MGKMFLILSLVFAASLSFAAPVKVCFWSRGDSGSKGDRIVVAATKQVITVKSDTTKAWEGTYKNEGAVKGRDGKTYLSYDGKGDEGYTAILFDSSLLQAGTQGWMKIRWRGESFMEDIYFCRDNR